jgi:tRNA(Arg) A34 adenosine deaminase TadA
VDELREDYIDKVIDYAKQSEAKFRHAAICLDKKGQIVSWATNSRKTHPMQAEYARRTGKDQKVSLHAEIAALINKRCELRNSKPCPICRLALEEAQVNEVWFSTDRGFEKL